MQFSVTIPQLFYDLIARMIPGSLFLIMLSYEISGIGVNAPSLTNLSGNLLFITLLILISGIMSYLMGWVLPSFSFLSAERNIKKEYEATLKAQKITVSIREMNDLIRIKNEGAGFRILKRRAEARMLESSRVGMFCIVWIATGLMLLNILKLLPSSNNTALEWIIKIIIPIILTFAFWKQERHAWQAYYDNTISHYKILSSIEKKHQSKI
jgi:hypothetical protein